MNERILVIGGSSMLSAFFLKNTQSRGVITLQSNRDPSFGRVFDVTNKISLDSELDQIKPTVILNFAAATNVDWCETNIQGAYTANCLIPQLLNAWMNDQHHSPYLVQISTDQIYDSDLSEHAREDQPNPTNVYGLTKLLGEQFCAQQNACTLRTNFFGKSLAKKNSFTDWIYDSIQTNQKITGFSDIHFSPIHYSTLVECIDIAIAERLTGVFNAGSSGGISKYEFIRSFADQVGHTDYPVAERTSDHAVDLVKRPKNMMMDSSKIFSIMGKSQPNIEQEICSASREYQI